MEEFLNTLYNQEIDNALVIFLMLFSLGLALFHTFIIGSLLDVKLKPTWFFFLFNPVLLGITALLYRKIFIFIFILLVVSVFILGIIGGIRTSIIQKREYDNEKKNFTKNTI